MIDPTSSTPSQSRMLSPDAANAITPRLGLWDAVSIIVGIVIGTAVFRSSTTVFQNVAGPGWALAMWVVGGAVSWCGAVCYAELATTYPDDGGDYVYLTKAFGSWCGFLFAAAQLTVIISGNIGIMAYAFADYGLELWPAWKAHAVWLAVTPVVVLSLLNLMGIVAGKMTQNLLSVLKVAGLSAIVLAALLSDAKPRVAEVDTPAQTFVPNVGLALVFVLYAYGGWTHAAYVAAEVHDQRRNLPRALLFGIAGIVVIYLAVNAAYLKVLGFEGDQQTPTPAADVMLHAVGPWGGRAVSLLVMLSALGAINGMILTGTRIYAVWGKDYPALAWLGNWNRRAGPSAAIVVQAAIAVALILLVGTQAGRGLFDGALNGLGFAGLPWEKYFGGFETLVAGSAPVYWGLCLLTGLAVFVLRFRNDAARRPYSIPFFPLPPLVFCGACGFMLYASLDYARWLVLIGVVPLAVSGALWCFLRRNSADH